MKNKKLELLRTKLAMFVLATSLGVTALSRCNSDKILSSEEIESCIEETRDLGRYAGLYKKQDGNWGIYFTKNDKHYDFKSYEYLSDLHFHTMLDREQEGFGSWYSYLVGYLPFNKCNSDVTYTLNVINNLTESDIEKLKSDFFAENSFRAKDIQLFYIEKIDGTNKQAIIGYPLSDTEIFNIETWQSENYEGYAIVKESCDFNNSFVYLSEILGYLNEKKNNIEVSSIEAETFSTEDEEIQEEMETTQSFDSVNILEDIEAINETEEQFKETTEAETSSVENQDNQTEIETTSNLESINILEETENINETEPSLEAEKNVGYEIHSRMANSYIYIKDNLTSENLTEEEVLDFLINQKDKIDTITIMNLTSDNNKSNIEKILKEISKNNYITSLNFSGFESLNLSDVLTIPQLKDLQLTSCILEDDAQLNQFTQLESLYLYDNNVKDLNIISNLTQLQDLTILNKGTELTNIEILKKFENLNYLCLMDCNLSDVSALYDLNHLMFLNLEGNPIQNLSKLTNMKSAPIIYLTDKANLSDLKSCMEELTEKGINIYCDSNGKANLITKEYLEQKEEAQLKLKK